MLSGPLNIDSENSTQIYYPYQEARPLCYMFSWCGT